MADDVPKEGSWYALKEQYGDAHGAIPQYAACQVTHVLPPGSIGAGVHDADVVLMRYLERSSVTNRICQRRFSVRLESFDGMFAAGAKPVKELREWDAAQKNKGGG